MPKAKILVVEDEAITAQDIKSTLERLGYEVGGIASNGDDALKMAGSFLPALALMDIVLKGPHSGVATAMELRRQFEIPVIFLTAYADNSTLTQAKKAEPVGYLTKPFNETDLRAAVEMGIYKAGMEAERRDLMKKLQEALDNVKTLSGLIPICASCKQIRNDEGYWQTVEQYIREHTEADFTHGICPVCYKKLYPDY